MALNVGLFKEEIKYPVKKQGNSGDVGIPLGLLYLASYLRDNSETNVKIIDHRLIKAKKQSINLETELQNLDIVGIGACTCEIPKALELLTEAKKHNKITVMGGIYPTLNTAQVLNSGIVDYVILGEGEIAFNSLIKAIELDLPTKGIPGIISAKDFKNGIEYTKAKNVKDLDSLPNPAYDLISLKDYSKFTSAHIYASRGCTQKCEYCTPNKFWGYEHRRRGIENIVSEIKFLKENGFEKINFKDETITLNPIWTEELFTELKRLNLGVKYKIKSRVSDVNEKMLDLLASTGVEEIHMGLESVCQKSLNNMKKNICADIILSVSESILTRGITLNPVFMLSWIGETKEDLKFNTDFIKKLGSKKNVKTYLSFITPHPGTPLYENKNNELQILTHDYNRYTHKQPVAVPRSLGKEGLDLLINAYEEIRADCNMEFFNPTLDQNYITELKEEIGNNYYGN